MINHLTLGINTSFNQFLKILSLSFIALFATITSYAQDFKLVEKGKPVAVFDNIQFQDSSVRRVAAIFNNYIEKITGTRLTNEGRIGGYHVYFGLLSEYPNPIDDKLMAIKDKEAKRDAFYIRAFRGNLSFHALSAVGLENAVYSFLEKYCNVRFYAHDAIVIPKTGDLSVPFDIDWFEVPAFNFRIPYYSEASFEDYIKWHKLSSEPKSADAANWPVSRKWGLWVHTLHRLLPPDKWFNAHPEYYALRNGARTTDQVCLSNPNVLEVVYTNLRKEIEANPMALYWSVSQMDNFNYCECDDCKRIDSLEGSHSGTMLRFVNQLAARFPDKVISTLAYQYTRSAPQITKPLPNVNIMLCTIECNRNKPIADDKQPVSFYADLYSWTALTNNILIWDYVINFSHLLVPFPNLGILDDNLRMFKEAEVTMMFEQGLRGCSGGEMNELRTYLLAKLLWNPYLSTDSLINDFVIGYYGEHAAPYIKEYLYKIDQELKQSGLALTLYEPPATHATGYLSPENLISYFELFNQALEASAGNEIAIHRINMAMQSLRYAWLEVSKALPFTPHWLFKAEKPFEIKEANLVMLNELTTRAKEFGPALFHEIRLSPDEYEKSMLNYFKEGVNDHIAVGKSVTYKELPATAYSAHGNGSLVDGVHGTGAYQVLWQGWQRVNCDATIDLDEIQPIHSVTVGYLEENQSWIMAPRSVEVFLSDDGNTYSKAGEIVNSKAGIQLPAYTDKITLEFDKPLTGRYIRVIVHNYGKLPQWRGVDADSWVFVDEIEVH